MDPVLAKECSVKDPDAIQYWHNEYPSELAQLQKDIFIKRFEDARSRWTIDLLNLYLVSEENEGVVLWILEITLILNWWKS